MSAAAEALARTEAARARAILDASIDCVITIDHEGRVLEFNPAAEKTFGYRREDVIGVPIGDLVVPERLRAKHSRGLALYRETGHGPIVGKRVELPALRSDGTEILVEVTVTRLDVAGPPIFTATLRDLGEDRPAERIRRSQDFYRIVTEPSSDLTALLDLDGRVVYASPSHEAKLGRPSATFVGEELLSFVHADDAELVRTAFLEARAGVRRLFPPVRMTRGQGEWLSVEGALTGIVADDGSVMVILLKARDVSDDLDRSATRDREERAQRDFVTNAAHELQTPLAAVIAAVDVLQAGAKHRPVERDLFLGDIERGTARLRRLTRALFELAQLQAGAADWVAEPIVIGGLVAEVASGLAVADGVEVVTDCSDDAIALGDRDVLELALSNVGRNAAMHTEQGTICVVARRRGDSVAVTVRDSGHGMSAEERIRATEPFYRGDLNKRPGFGLGLALVREATRVLGGTLEIESELGVGTSVTVTLRAA